MARKGTRDIEVSVLLGEQAKLFLSPTTPLGEQILNRLSSGDYQITKVSAGIMQGVGRLPENTIVIEQVGKQDNEDEQE